MASLILTSEVLLHSPAGVGFPNKPIAEHLDLVEEEIRNNCLGADLFDYLVTKLTDVSSAEEWIDCGDYALADLVIRNGVYYQSTANQNNTDPLAADSDWTAVPKFTDACCNSLWERYLRKILAYQIYFYALPFATMTSGAGGLTIQALDPRGERAATPAEIGKAQTDVDRVIKTLTINMIRWLGEEAQSTCGFPSRATDNCATCDTETNTRFFW